MSRERVIKQNLKQVYIKLSIRRGLSEKKLNRLNSECWHLESTLKPSVIDNVANQAVNYLEMEEPGWGSRPKSS